MATSEVFELADAEPRAFGRTVTFRFTHDIAHNGMAIDALGQMMAVVARQAWALGDPETAIVLSEAANAVIVDGLDGAVSSQRLLADAIARADHDAGPDRDLANDRLREAERRLLQVIARWMHLRDRLDDHAARWGETVVDVRRAPDGSRTLTIDVRPLDADPGHPTGALGAEVSVRDTVPLPTDSAAMAS